MTSSSSSPIAALICAFRESDATSCNFSRPSAFEGKSIAIKYKVNNNQAACQFWYWLHHHRLKSKLVTLPIAPRQVHPRLNIQYSHSFPLEDLDRNRLDCNELLSTKNTSSFLNDFLPHSEKTIPLTVCIYLLLEGDVWCCWEQHRSWSKELHIGTSTCTICLCLKRQLRDSYELWQVNQHLTSSNIIHQCVWEDEPGWAIWHYLLPTSPCNIVQRLQAGLESGLQRLGYWTPATYTQNEAYAWTC